MTSSPLDRLYRTAATGAESPVSPATVEFRVVRTMDELKTALHLVYTEYMQRGYLKPHPSQLKLSLFQALPTTVAFLALHEERAIGTLSVILDSPLGLPMDEAYKPELDTLRRQGRRLAEVSLFSFNTSLFKQDNLVVFDADRLMLTLHLFKTMLDYTRHFTKTTDLIGCFHPNHRSFYNFIHVEPLGGLKSYSPVNGHPAVAAHFHIPSRQAMSTEYPVLRYLFESPESTEQLQEHLVLSEEQLRHLFVYSSPVFASASPSEMAHVQQCYPAYRLLTHPAKRPPQQLHGPLSDDQALVDNLPLIPPPSQSQE